MSELFPIFKPEIADRTAIEPKAEHVGLISGCYMILVESCLNAEGKRVVSQLAAIDESKCITRRVHALVSHEDYQSYLDRRITLRALQERASELYVEDAKAIDSSGAEYQVWRVDLDDIPNEYRPTDQSWYERDEYLEAMNRESDGDACSFNPGAES